MHNTVHDFLHARSQRHVESECVAKCPRENDTVLAMYVIEVTRMQDADYRLLLAIQSL